MSSNWDRASASSCRAPRAPHLREEEAAILLIEPTGVVNTGNVATRNSPPDRSGDMTRRIALPAKTALLVATCSGQSTPRAGGRRVPATTRRPKRMSRLAGCVAARRAADLSHQHDSTSPTSTYRPGQPGNDFKPEARPLDGEAVIIKRTNSAFIGTELEARLCGAGIATLVTAASSQ